MPHAPPVSRRAVVLTLGDAGRLARVHRNIETLHELGFAIDVVSPVPPTTASLPIRSWIPLSAWSSTYGLTKVYVTAGKAALKALATTAAALRMSGIMTVVIGLRKGVTSAVRAAVGMGVDVVLVEEIELLPFGLEVKARTGARVVVDIRDLYWMSRGEGLAHRIKHLELRYLYEAFLVRADATMVVSRGQQLQLEEGLGIKPVLVMSTPRYHEITPAPLLPGLVRLVHHGLASRNRRLEVMIEAAMALGSGFVLDLFLIAEDAAYLSELHRLAANDPRIRFREPVPLAKLVDATASYDVGLAFFPPATSNLRSALPNKLFEYVQARLAVVTGGSEDMARIGRDYGFGVSCEEFTSECLSSVLSELDAERITRMKYAAHDAAKVLSFEHQRDLLVDVLDPRSSDVQDVSSSPLI